MCCLPKIVFTILCCLLKIAFVIDIRVLSTTDSIYHRRVLSTEDSIYHRHIIAFTIDIYVCSLPKIAFILNIIKCAIYKDNIYHRHTNAVFLRHPSFTVFIRGLSQKIAFTIYILMLSTEDKP